MKRNKTKDYIFLIVFGLASLLFGFLIICYSSKKNLFEIIINWGIGVFLILWGLLLIVLSIKELFFPKKRSPKGYAISRDDRIKGSLYGFFVGDALGVPVEFLPRDELKKHPVIDMIGNGTHNQPKGTWSDDSSMVLATIDSLYENKDKNIKDKFIDYIDLMNRFLMWKEKGEYTPFGKMFDIGHATEEALSKYKKDRSNPFCGKDDINSNGNGSLMRMLPIVLYSSEYSGSLEYARIAQQGKYEVIRESSSLTHAHVLSTIACQIYNEYLTSCMFPFLDSHSAYRHLSSYFKDFFDKNRVGSKEDTELCKQYFHRLIYEDISQVDISEIKSSGFVVDTLEASIYCVLTTNNYKDAVLKAVNLGEDTDTIAAITGSLAGALYGINDIPVQWINSLQRKELIDEYVNKYMEINDLKINMTNNFKVNPVDMDRIKKSREKQTKNSWNIKELGDKTIEININIVLSKEEKEKLDYGHYPEYMEDHWFMYVDLDEKTINYHRSWTGIQIYKAFYKEEKDKIVIYKLVVNNDKEQYKGKDKKKEEETFKKFIQMDIKNNEEESK